MLAFPLTLLQMNIIWFPPYIRYLLFHGSFPWLQLPLSTVNFCFFMFLPYFFCAPQKRSSGQSHCHEFSSAKASSNGSTTSSGRVAKCLAWCGSCCASVIEISMELKGAPRILKVTEGWKFLFVSLMKQSQGKIWTMDVNGLWRKYLTTLVSCFPSMTRICWYVFVILMFDSSWKVFGLLGFSVGGQIPHQS